MVNVSRSVNVEGEQTRGKNENAVRSFQLSALACHVLDEQRKAAGGLGSVFRITNEQHYYKRWKTYCAANGLTSCSLYELRHTFVSVVKTLPPVKSSRWWATVRTWTRSASMPTP